MSNTQQKIKAELIEDIARRLSTHSSAAIDAAIDDVLDTIINKVVVSAYDKAEILNRLSKIKEA